MSPSGGLSVHQSHPFQVQVLLGLPCHYVRGSLFRLLTGPSLVRSSPFLGVDIDGAIQFHPWREAPPYLIGLLSAVAGPLAGSFEVDDHP